MDQTTLPLPSNLPSANNWRADLDTWHDKFVLVDPSGLIFFETQRREYVVSPVSYVRRSLRCNITSDNTALSGRPSEAFRRKSCPFPNEEPCSTLADVTKAEPSNSSQIDEQQSLIQPEVLKNTKRRRVENPSGPTTIPPRKESSATSLVTSNLTSVKKTVKSKLDWRRYKKAATSSLSKLTESSQSTQSSSIQALSSKVNRKRTSDVFDAAPVAPSETTSAELEALRTRLNLHLDAPLICSICSSPSLLHENWRGYRFEKLACRACGRFVENALIYAPSKTVPVCITGLQNCSVHYTNNNPCRFCRLKKCIAVWPPESLPLQKFANQKAKEIWLNQRRPLLQALNSSPPSRVQQKPLPSPAKHVQQEITSKPKDDSCELAHVSRRSSRAVRHNSESAAAVVVKEEQQIVSGITNDEPTTRRSTRPGRGSKMTDIIESINAPVSKLVSTRRRPSSRQTFSDDASVASSSKDISNAASNDFDMGDFVVDRPISPVAEQSEKQQPKGRGNARQKSKAPVADEPLINVAKQEKLGQLPVDEASTSKTVEAEPERGDLFWCSAPKPRAAALAATAAIRTQNAEHTRRTSLTPKKETQKEPESHSAEPSPPKKQRRTVGGFQPQQQRISVSSLKSVKPKKSLKGKEVVSKKVTPPRRNSSEPNKSVLDSPEYVPPVTDELKTSINRLKADGDRKPRIKHVFRQPSSTFLPRNGSGGNLASGNSSPPHGPAQPLVAGKNGPPPTNQYFSRSPTPPPPLTAPIRITNDKFASKPLNINQGGKSGSNENKKGGKKSVGAVVSPTRSNQQLKATRCNRCPGCRLADCGKCRYCLDMPKFGGAGQLHHACEKRVCQFQDRLQEFTYRRIKLPTIQLPSDAPAPVCAIKEASVNSTASSASNASDGLKSPVKPRVEPEKPEQPQVLLTPPQVAEVTVSSGSPNGSTELPRRSSLCSDGLHCGSPIPNLLMQSPVREEVVVSSDVVKEEQQTEKPTLLPPPAPLVEQQKSEEELVDVSSLKPILSEFESVPTILASSESRRRRVCAAILDDVSLERALNEGVAIVTTASLIPAIRALCLLCGSAGREPMVFCQLCAHPFHTFCISLFEEDSKETLDLSEIDLANWLCPSCRYCELCQQPSATNNKLARCTKCHYYFHPACLAPNYPVPKKKTKSIWVCSRCVKCEDCGATHPGRGVNAQWSSDFKLCQSCNDAHGQNFCPECLETYAADDYTLRMLQCNRCDAWIHANPCAGLTEDLYDLFEFLPDSVHFVCMKCAKKLSLSRPQAWEIKVQRLLADRLGDMLAVFVTNINEVVTSLNQGAEKTEEALQCQAAVEGMEAEETKDLWQLVCEGLVKASFRGVSTFIFDFWKVVKVRGVQLEWLTDNLLALFDGMNPTFKKRVRAETLAKVEEKKENSPIEKATDRKAKKEAEKKKQEEENAKKKAKSVVPNKQNETILQNTALINRTSEDARMCRLCCRFGDGDPQQAGRLLYAGQDDWVHVNCALWSAEVFERGSLLCNVTQALARSRHLKCFYCGRTGATLQCREQGCRMDFHFMCARENNHAFTEDHTCYCPDHIVEEKSISSSEDESEESSGSDSDSDENDDDDDDGIAYISDFSVDRRLICDPDSIRWRRNWLDGFNSQDITIVVGSLSVMRLGTVCELSDVKHVLIPLQYTVDRVHWDADDPFRLRVYRCTVDAVQSPHLENPNSIASTTVFRTPGKVSDKAFENELNETKTPEVPQVTEHPIQVSVPVPPLPEPVPSPTPPPVKRTLDFDDDVPATNLPLVIWQGASANWNKQGVVRPTMPPPPSPQVARPTPSPKMMTPSPNFAADPAALNKVRRLIDLSPNNDNSNTATLMRTIHQQSLSPKKSDSLSRVVPFAHQKPQIPTSSSATVLRLSSPPPKPVRPNIPLPDPEPPKIVEQTQPSPVVEPEVVKKVEPLVASSENVTAPEPLKGVCRLFSQTPNPDVLELVDHVVSRVSFEDGDFLRHGSSLLQEYASPNETTLHLLRTASAINGKTVPTAAANDFYSSTMWNKYKIRTKNRNSLPGPKPVVCGPSPNSGIVPIILNHSQSKMNAARPPEMDLFPVSIFPAPRFGMRAKRHADIMQQANDAILAEQKAEEARQKALTPVSTAQFVKSQVVNKQGPLAQLVNATPGAKTATTVVRQIPIARLSLVSGPIPAATGSAGGTGPRIFQIRPISQIISTGPQVAAGPQPPRFSLKTVSMAGTMVQQPPRPPQLTSVINKTPFVNNFGNKAVMSVSGPMGPILNRSQPDIQVPVRTITTAPPLPQSLLPAPKLQVATPPFLNIPLPPISPISQPSSTGRPSILSPPTLDFGIGPKLPAFISPSKVRFQDNGPIVSPQKMQKLTSPQQNKQVAKPDILLPSQITSDLSLAKKSERAQKRKEAVKKRDLPHDLLPNDTAKKTKSQNSTDAAKKAVMVAKRPKTPLSLATLLPKSPLKACLPTTELALAEIVNRVVTESVLLDGHDSKKTQFVARQRAQQRYLVFEIMPSDLPADQAWKIRAFTWQDSWRVLFSRLSETRQSRGLTQLCYDSVSGLSLLGLTQSSIVALIEQLPGVEEETSAYMFRFARYERTAPNPAGCARAQPYLKYCPGQRRHRDVFSFLLSGYRRPKVRTGDGDQEQSSLTASMAGSSGGLVSWEVSRAHKTLRRPTALLDLPLPTRLRYLTETARYDVGVFRSTIHARGLYALRNFEAQEMIIEYAGELIRATLTDKRERMYERQGIGCYMFRLDDTTVIDATRCGNAGRFINHCCEPNCYSRVIVGYEGLKHIVIFALRPIAAGEELTYDYKFPLEDAASKIPCYCGARRCRKYLN